MLNSTVELIRLWASSSSPPLLAFCLSHLIIALILLFGRGGGAALEISGGAVGERTPEATGSETSRGGEEVPAAAIDADDRAEELLVLVGDADGAIEILTSEKCSAREEEFIAADASQEQQDDDGEDELMTRAEEFIQRMNRVWMAENLRVC